MNAYATPRWEAGAVASNPWACRPQRCWCWQMQPGAVCRRGSRAGIGSRHKVGATGATAKAGPAQHAGPPKSDAEHLLGHAVAEKRVGLGGWVQRVEEHVLVLRSSGRRQRTAGGTGQAAVPD